MTNAREYVRRVAALGTWSYGVWVLLTWTATAEQLVFGGVLALAVALALAPFGPVVGPWRLLWPPRTVAVIRLAGHASVQIVRANLVLASRIWRPSRPLRSGMIIVPTSARTDGELAATGVISSLIVDNQLVDLDRGKGRLQYHAVDVPEGDRAEAINAPIERLVAKVRQP